MADLHGEAAEEYYTYYGYTTLSILTTADLHREAAEEGVARLDADLVSIVLP